MRTKYVRLSAAGVVASGEAVLAGFRVNTTSSGTMKLHDYTSVGGTNILGTITPAVGFHDCRNLHLTVGGYAEITNMDVTFLVLEQE